MGKGKRGNKYQATTRLQRAQNATAAGLADGSDLWDPPGQGHGRPPEQNQGTYFVPLPKLPEPSPMLVPTSPKTVMVSREVALAMSLAEFANAKKTHCRESDGSPVIVTSDGYYVLPEGDRLRAHLSRGVSFRETGS